jgi:tRNA threonylcarbamoyladenosine modification (KEOPS) complex  Pcc1 subunit
LNYEVKPLKAQATVRLRFCSGKRPSTLLNALLPEANAPATRRATTILEKEGTFLFLRVEAKDTIALRATLNAYLRWIGSTLKVLEVIERE